MTSPPPPSAAGRPHRRGTRLLCTTNFEVNVGYAWDFVEGIHAELARLTARSGGRTFVAYTLLDAQPNVLRGTSAEPVELDTRFRTWRSILATCRFIRRHRIDTVYLTDRRPRSWVYPLLRLSGARRIIVHDHASGERTAPQGAKRLAKRVLAMVPAMTADVVIAVSEYVARRQRTAALVPPSRVRKILNGISDPNPTALAPPSAEPLPLPAGRPIVACACRSTPEKGVEHLFRAFDLVAQNWAGPSRPYLVYAGHGPVFAALRALRDSLPSRDDILMAGYRPDVARLLQAADICVVPSVWQDACPLSVIEPMFLGKPLVASAVGGVPELLGEGEAGLLVPPADPEALARAITSLLTDTARARRLADAARTRARRDLTRERMLSELLPIVLPGTPRGGRPAAEAGAAVTAR